MNLTAIVKRDEVPNVWLAELADEPRVHTFGNSVKAALAHLTDAAALWYEVDPSEITFAGIDAELGATTKALDAARKARLAVAAAEGKSRIATERAVKAMVEDGLSQRDIAALLGISHQRVNQLVAGMSVHRSGSVDRVVVNRAVSGQLVKRRRPQRAIRGGG